jgi:hypothetical protein
MRRYFAAERAKGRTPSGAELDRLVGRDPRNGAGRKARARYLAETQQPTGETRTALVPAPAGGGQDLAAVRLRPVPPSPADPELPQGVAADA